MLTKRALNSPTTLGAAKLEDVIADGQEAQTQDKPANERERVKLSLTRCFWDWRQGHGCVNEKLVPHTDNADEIYLPSHILMYIYIYIYIYIYRTSEDNASGAFTC